MATNRAELCTVASGRDAKRIEKMENRSKNNQKKKKIEFFSKKFIKILII